MTDRTLRHLSKTEQRAIAIRTIRIRRDFQDWCAMRFLSACTREQRLELVAAFGE